MPDYQTNNGNIDKSSGTVYSWLKSVPPSDSNFTSNLNQADAGTIRAVLADLPVENNVSKRKILEARLRKLEKNQPAIEPPTAPVADESEVVAIEIERILPSSFETQSRRRARFKPEEIESLGASIAKHKMRQPILVRPVYPNFEIVFGERRFLAAQSINLAKINCFIDNLTDEETLELQYEENHRRQENTALDDAFLFKFLMKKYGYTEEQLADRLGTTRRNVIEKLRLNDLIDEAKQELEGGSLPLRHAYFMATLATDSQREIVRSKYAYKYYDTDEKPVSFREFKAEIDENILKRLKTAPFNIGDPRLHIKNLICVECPEQTNFEKFSLSRIQRRRSLPEFGLLPAQNRHAPEAPARSHRRRETEPGTETARGSRQIRALGH